MKFQKNPDYLKERLQVYEELYAAQQKKYEGMKSSLLPISILILTFTYRATKAANQDCASRWQSKRRNEFRHQSIGCCKDDIEQSPREDHCLKGQVYEQNRES
jgi:hypothetical protein